MPRKIDMGCHLLIDKVNAVTLQDSNGYYDAFRCLNCGKVIRIYGIRTSLEYPGPCFVSKARSEEIKAKRVTKEQSEDAVVEGVWSRPGIESKCSKCNAVMVLCPREGHTNSKFWRLENSDGCKLFVCPNNCLEK